MRFLRVSLCSFYYVKGLDSCPVLFLRFKLQSENNEGQNNTYLKKRVSAVLGFYYWFIKRILSFQIVSFSYS